MVMWFNCMQFLDDQGLPLKELERRARTPTNLDGMRRWGYISIDGNTKRVPRPRAEAVIRPTHGGTISTLRKSLEPLVGDGTAEHSPLFKGIEPYPDGWRASVRKPETLPHYPMVLHRGGYPDGS
jgi:hypothetical protein